MKTLRTFNFEIVKLSKKERDEYPTVMTIPTYVQDVKACVNSLSDAGKRLFKPILFTHRQFPRWMTRHEIVSLIGRHKALPHDIRLINEMVSIGLLIQEKRARRKLSNGMPNGFEYVYTIPKNVLWACKELAKVQATPTALTDNVTPQTDKPTPTPPLYDNASRDQFFEQYKLSQPKPRRRWFGRK